MAQVFNWDSEISNDGNGLSFIILPDGQYTFEVTKFEKSFYSGNSTKIPANCPKADLEMTITTDDGISIIRDSIFLYDAFEWKLSSFFRCLGLKQHGQSVKMPWDKVLHAKGKASISSEEYTNRDGETKKKNIIKNYIDADKAVLPSADPADLPFEI